MQMVFGLGLAGMGAVVLGRVLIANWKAGRFPLSLPLPGDYVAGLRYGIALGLLSIAYVLLASL